MALFHTTVLDNQIKALSTIGTASGSIATFETDKAERLVNLEVAITAVGGGSGTPSPSNPRSINGFSNVVVTRCGKNLINPNNILRRSGYTTPNVAYNNGTFAITNYGDGGRFIAFNIKCVVGEKITIKHQSNSNLSTTAIGYTFSDTQPLAWKGFGTSIPNPNQAYTITATKEWLQVFVEAKEGTSTATITDLQCERGENATTYEAYNGTTETIPFGQTVYGGRLNVGSGVLTVTHGYTTINDCIASRTTSYDNPVFYGSITGLKNTTANIICEDFNVISGKPSASSFASASDNYDFAINSANTGASVQVFLRCDEYSDVTSLKTAVGSSLVVYELASNTVIQLDSKEVASIVGNNNIYADCGNIIDLKFILTVGQAIS